MRHLSVLAAFLLLVGVVNCYNTWYIRADGGDRSMCNGLADAPVVTAFPSVPQNCAFGDFRFLWDNHTYGLAEWVISGGDTVIIDNTKDWFIGRDQGTDGYNSIWCEGVDCTNPAIPPGTAANPTRLLGRNYQSCTYGSGVWTIPDPAKVSRLVGRHGQGCVLNFGSTSYVEVQCLEVTSYIECQRGGYGGLPGCNAQYPWSDYTNTGLCIDSATTHVHFQDVWSHGHEGNGMGGSPFGVITFDRLRLSNNGQCGWEMDNGQTITSGSVSGSHLFIEWSGCYEKFPASDQFHVAYCYDDNSAGYGDALGTPSSSINFTCDQCATIFNTQDGFDFAHNYGQGVFVEVSNSLSYGNMGSQLKSAPNQQYLIQNNILVSGCARMAEPIPGASSTFNQYLSDFCRAAGDFLPGGFYGSQSYTETKLVQYNTILGYAATFFDVGCGTPCNNVNYTVENNIIMGVQYKYYNDDQLPGLYYGITPTTQDHNIFYNMRTCPTLYTGDTCSSPQFVNQLFGSEIPNEAFFDTFNFALSSSSPAIGTAVPLNTIASDFTGTPRNPTNPSKGALEATSSFDLSPYFNDPKRFPPRYTPPTPGPATYLGTYLGCYADGNPRDLNGPYYVGWVSAERCNIFCSSQNYTYFGLQYTSYCFCGNSYGAYGELSDSYCNFTCSANATEICGQGSVNSVYSTRPGVIPTTPKPATPKPSTPKPSPKPATTAPTQNPCAKPATGSGNTGLRGDYYFGTNFNTYNYSEFDSTVDFNYGTGGPNIPGFLVDQFSIRWTGTVFAPYSGVYNFYVSSDDGTRLWVNNQLLINAWVDQAETENSGTITLIQGKQYSIVLEYYENLYTAAVHLSWSHSCIAKQIIPKSNLFHAGSGLTGRYYNNVDFSGNYVACQVDPTVNFNWGTGAPAVLGSQTDGFAIVWDGFVAPPCTGTYTFYVYSEDGSDFYENYNQVINAWESPDGLYTHTSPAFSFQAGQLHPISIEYHNDVGNAQVALYWTSSCGNPREQVVVPQSALYPVAQ